MKYCSDILLLPGTGEKWEYSETIHQLLINDEKTYDSVRREEFYNILTQCGIPMILARLI
jgi:hypothetical protein